MILFFILLNIGTIALGYGPEDFVHVLGATQFGFWGETQACPNGSYAYAFDIMLEKEQGIFDDNTAVNAISLHCGTPDGTHTGEVTSATMDRGKWQGVLACAPGTFLVGYNIKSEADNSDQTAANGIYMWCQGAPDVILYQPETKWGVWLEQAHCTNSRVICGLMTNVEEDQGAFSDDSCLNDVRFLCCDIPA